LTPRTTPEDSLSGAVSQKEKTDDGKDKDNTGIGIGKLTCYRVLSPPP
jgi:hypothetical protein